jgi:hypothetical protein
MMRALMLAAGVGAAVVGFAVATHQAIVCLQSGFWPQIRFGELWFALGGATPDMLPLGSFDGLLDTLLNQPLSAVLLFGGMSIAWISAARTSHIGSRF